MDFVHLHNHTHYSLLDALCTPEELINAAVADGQKALALTDHGVMFGCYEFYRKAKAAKIKPIIGFEAYVANGSRFDKTAGKSKTKKKNYYHLVLLAKNEIGYKNLLKLTSLAHTEGFYYKPRIDKELLEQYNEGIIASSACIAGVISHHLINNDYDKAYEEAKYYKDIFGEDFYIELQSHFLTDDQIVLSEAPKIAKKLGLKLIATNDIHYLNGDHAIAHNILLNIKDVTAATSGQVDIYKLRYRTPEMYFKTKEEMIKLFSDFPEAIDNTNEVADKCNINLDTELHMPEFPLPKDKFNLSHSEYLEELTFNGIKQRYNVITDEIAERARFELEVINKMNFPSYFLIVGDFIKAAKELGVSVGPGRGSAAGSIVAYALGITNIDPLPYGLLFERFLNPDRVSMPDIDIDFNDETRDRVIDYVRKKYGDECVAQIITFGKLSSRAVLKDVGRVLGVELSKINEITSKIPVVQGKVADLKEALELSELKWVKNSDDPKIRELINYSLLLENKFRNSGLHAAGVVIAPKDIREYVPVYMASKAKGHTAEIATQYSMNELEYAGLLKMDFLGLRTLSIIDKTLEMIKINHGKDIFIDEIDFNDEKTYELISNGDSLAVFQFESQGMQDYLRQLKPKDLEELTAMNALYRPGPMANIPDFIDRKHGKKPIQYLHPIMEKSLKNTYGIIVYQEQVMQLARDIAGFTLAQADILRRAMGKKKKSEMDKLQPAFIEGAKKNGLDEKLSNEVYDLIEKFSSYGFNKSHSLAYSYLAFQTAWLKTYYPAEFLAANMSAELNNQDKIVQLIEEAKKFNIKVMPPDVNKSYAGFTPVENSILFGLAGIKNVGKTAVESIIKAREEKPFQSFFDFLARVDTKLINKRSLEALICSGAFDSMHCGHRAALMDTIESGLEYAKAYHEAKNSQIESLFGGGSEVHLVEPAIKETEEWTEKLRLDKEKEVLNFYVSGNPLDRFFPYVDSLPTLYLGDKDSKLIGEQVRVCGIISDVKTRYDRYQNPIAFVQLEDYTGRANCIIRSKVFAAYKNKLNTDDIVLFLGRSELSGEELKVIVDEVLTYDEASARYAKGYSLWIDIEKNGNDTINNIKKLCVDDGKTNTLIFNLYNKSNKNVSRYVSYDVHIPVSHNVVNKLINFVGKNNIKFVLE